MYICPWEVKYTNIIDKVVNRDKLQYTCIRLRSLYRNNNIFYGWNIGAKMQMPTNGQMVWSDEIFLFRYSNFVSANRKRLKTMSPIK